MKTITVYRDWEAGGTLADEPAARLDRYTRDPYVRDIIDGDTGEVLYSRTLEARIVDGDGEKIRRARPSSTLSSLETWAEEVVYFGMGAVDTVQVLVNGSVYNEFEI